MATKQKRWDDALGALASARKSAQSEVKQAEHPFFARLAIDLELQRGATQRAIELADQSIQQYPGSAAIRLLRIQAQVRAKQYAQAIAQIEDDLVTYASQPTWWQLMGEAYDATGKTGLSHWATGERYAMLGGFSAALTQFQIARKDKSIGFYRLSQIDARIADMQREIIEEKKALKN